MERVTGVELAIKAPMQSSAMHQTVRAALCWAENQPTRVEA
jgi:hypothetical protein